MRRFLIVIAVIFIIVVSAFGGAKLFPSIKFKTPEKEVYREVLNEESAVIKAVDAVTPSVVTIGIKKTQKTDSLSVFFNLPAGEKLIEENIGTGFIISKEEGLVITNRHVVADVQAEYKIITADNQELAAEKIYRDQINDMAIIKVSPPVEGFKAINLGDSDNLKVGQIVIAIGTALGEFRSTVTTGVISGLGRGINAGSPLGGMSERVDNAIQTDAAINLGNSGGPLLNSSGEVIGVNVAVSQAGQNISFAIPINIVKEAIKTFEATGKFSRPYLGVRYRMLTTKTALLNNVPQGAYVVELVKDSPAEKGSLKTGDIVTQIDELKLDENNGIAEVIAKKKVGDEIKLKVYRDGQEITIKVKLEEVGSQ